MDYTSLHTRILATVEKWGTAVTFSTGGRGTYDSATDTWVATEASGPVTGKAVEVPGDLEEYQSLELIPSQTLTLMFVPDDLGDVPALNSRVTWAGAARTVRAIRPIRPDGTVLAARVMVTA